MPSLIIERGHERGMSYDIDPRKPAVCGRDTANAVVFSDPGASRKHFKIEGTQLFWGLLFVPKKPPFDLFSPDLMHKYFEGFAEDLPTDQCRAVLLHEVAHVARRDSWVGLAQRFSRRRPLPASTRGSSAASDSRAGAPLAAWNCIAVVAVSASDWNER